MEEEKRLSYLKVLIVDDYGNMRAIIKKILSKIGITNTDQAPDGRVALTKMRRHPFDLILLDWNMPEFSGLQVLKIMQSDPELSDIPVILVTAEALEENIVAAAKAGAKDYMVKPFDAETLKEKIMKVLEKPKMM